MKKNYSEQEMQEILSAEQKISPKVEARIQETYKMLGVKNGEKKTIHKKIAGWKKALTCAAACAALLTTVTVVRPTWAEELFGKAFQNLISSAKDTKYEQEDTTLYTQVGKNAKNLEKEGQKENQGQIPITASAEGVTVGVSDVYSDGYRLYYTVTLSADREGLNQADFISIAGKNSEEIPSLKINGQDVGLVNLSFTKGDDGTYTAMGNEDLLYLRKEGGFQIPEEGTLDVSIELKGLWGYLDDEWEPSPEDESLMEYKMTDEVLADWKVGFTTDIDTSQNKTWEINQEQNGITVTKIIRTAANLIAVVECPDFTKEPYLDQYNDPAILLFDSAKEDIPMQSVYTDPGEEGRSTQYINCTYNEDETLFLQVINKNVDDSILADFEIHLK